MTPAVNLVPLARMQARQRARRRTAWLTVSAIGLALCAVGWGAQRAARGALTQLAERVGALEAQRADTQRRLIASLGRRTQLLDRLHTLAAARRPQPWVDRLIRLTREAPESVLITALSVSSSVAPGAAAAAPSLPMPLLRRPGDAVARAEGAPPEAQSVQLRGYALDHAALLQFLTTLQKLPGWQKVDLVRATQEPFGQGHALAFEFDCRAGEGGP